MSTQSQQGGSGTPDAFGPEPTSARPEGLVALAVFVGIQVLFVALVLMASVFDSAGPYAELNESFEVLLAILLWLVVDGTVLAVYGTFLLIRYTRKRR